MNERTTVEALPIRLVLSLVLLISLVLIVVGMAWAQVPSRVGSERLATTLVRYPCFQDPPTIGVEDAQAMIPHWRRQSGDQGWDFRFDLNGDDKVDVVDFAHWGVLWGNTCLEVSGSVQWDNAGGVAGAQVTAGTGDSQSMVETVSDANGAYTVTLMAASLPMTVSVQAALTQTGLPPVTSVEWEVFQGGGSVQMPPIVLPNPAGAALTLSNGSAQSPDGSIQVSGVPPNVASLYARSYDPEGYPDAFPGVLAEGTTTPFNSSVFLWIAALDAEGNPVVDLSPPVTLTVQVPATQWSDLVDLTPGNGQIDIPIYSFNYTTGLWERRSDGRLVDEIGAVIPESQNAAIRAGTFLGLVFAQFLADHFSWWNVDYPPTTDLPDFGDAPDPSYPSLLSSNGAQHMNPNRAWLGPWVDGEADAEVPDGDLFDDGLLSHDPLAIRVSNWDWPSDLFVNVLVDSNEDGNWDDPGEWVIQNLTVAVSVRKGVRVETGVPVSPTKWMRITLTGDPLIDYTGQGVSNIGETEDYMRTSTHTLWVWVNGQGTVTSDPSGVNCRTEVVVIPGRASAQENDCQEDFPETSVVVLTATPDPGETFLGWDGWGPCASRGTNPTCMLRMNEDKFVGANFSAPTSVRVSLYGDGGVTSDPPGINCDTSGNNDCFEVFARLPVTLTATPAPGQSFERWGGACVPAVSWQSPARGQSFDRRVDGPLGLSSGHICVLESSWLYGRELSVEAYFTLASGPRRLDVHMWDIWDNGTVSSNPAGILCGTAGGDCAEGFADGTDVTLTAAPDPGERLCYWAGDCSGVEGADCTLTMDSDKNVWVGFSRGGQCGEWASGSTSPGLEPKWTRK